MYGLAHVAGWEAFNLHHLAYISWVGSVAYRSYTTPRKGRLASTVDDVSVDDLPTRTDVIPEEYTQKKMLISNASHEAPPPFPGKYWLTFSKEKNTNKRRSALCLSHSTGKYAQFDSNANTAPPYPPPNVPNVRKPLLQDRWFFGLVKGSFYFLFFFFYINTIPQKNNVKANFTSTLLIVYPEECVRNDQGDNILVILVLVYGGGPYSIILAQR